MNVNFGKGDGGMDREEIANAIIRGMHKAQKKYMKWMDGFSITGGPEYFLTVKIAEELHKLGNDFAPVLESSLKVASDNSGVKEKSEKICNSNGRGDVVLYYKDNPYSIIEVKRNHYKFDDECLSDIDRICDILGHEKSDTTWKNGYFAFIVEKDLLETNYTDIDNTIVDDIKKLHNIVKKKYPEQTKEYYYKKGNNNYEWEGKKRKMAWAYVCIAFS